MKPKEFFNKVVQMQECSEGVLPHPKPAGTLREQETGE